MFGTTPTAPLAISERITTATEPGLGPSVPITGALLPETETTATPEKSIPSGENAFVVDNYDRVGRFDFSQLKVNVLASGFSVFDKHFVLKRGLPQLVTIAAYTSHGKTAMMMQIAAHVSKTGPVFVHSFEMSKAQLETRLLSSIADFPAEKIMRGEIPKGRLDKAIQDYEQRQLYLCKSTNNTLAYIQTSCFEKAKQVGKPELIVVDYLQIMAATKDRQMRTIEIKDCMRGLKTLAEELQCPILLGAQMNRGCELRGLGTTGKDGVAYYRPITADLAESSSIAQDSDVVIFVTRQEQYDGTRENLADILCAKNRDGQVFEQTFGWSGETCSFREETTYKKLEKGHL